MVTGTIRRASQEFCSQHVLLTTVGYTKRLQKVEKQRCMQQEVMICMLVITSQQSHHMGHITWATSQSRVTGHTVATGQVSIPWMTSRTSKGDNVQ